MMTCRSLLLLLAVFTARGVRADVELPVFFSDHMVLQREAPVPVWGRAAAGENVTVRVAGQSRSTKADGEGKWSVKLGSMKAGGPHKLIVEAGTGSPWAM